VSSDLAQRPLADLPASWASVRAGCYVRGPRVLRPGRTLGRHRRCAADVPVGVAGEPSRRRVGGACSPGGTKLPSAVSMKSAASSRACSSRHRWATSIIAVCVIEKSFRWCPVSYDTLRPLHALPRPRLAVLRGLLRSAKLIQTAVAIPPQGPLVAEPSDNVSLERLRMNAKGPRRRSGCSPQQVQELVGRWDLVRPVDPQVPEEVRRRASRLPRATGPRLTSTTAVPRFRLRA
jgi:hypothetical protein